MARAREQAHDFFRAEAEHLSTYLERVNFGAYVDLLQRPFRLMGLNLLSGLFRGIGIGLGFTLVVSLLVLILQQLEILNLPVVGKYIAEIVRIVQAEQHVRSF